MLIRIILRFESGPNKVAEKVNKILTHGKWGNKITYLVSIECPTLYILWQDYCFIASVICVHMYIYVFEGINKVSIEVFVVLKRKI